MDASEAQSNRMAGAGVATRVVNIESIFGVSVPWPVHAFDVVDEHVPDVDQTFVFDTEVTRALLLGFAHNRRVYLHGPHGSGKSTHVEQVAARLNWPCLRINLDAQVTRTDLVGRDMVVLRDGQQVTEFVPGLLVWALAQPIALVLDEYDVARPDVMFVIQRLLESHGKLTLLDQNRVITPHPAFRLFATANTRGQGDASGLYAGTQAVNQAQMDRWHVVAELDYPTASRESQILCARFPGLSAQQIERMVSLAGLARRAFVQGDLTVLLSLRNLVTWAENLQLLSGDSAAGFRLAFWNRCEAADRALLAELYQRCFASELTA